ncbi:MAG: PhoX family phosphatase [Leptolyngbyaceae cyanobacterium]
MFEHDTEIVNRSGNRPFEEVLRTRLSRRGALRGMTLSAAGFAMAFAGNKAMATVSNEVATRGVGSTQLAQAGGLMGFTPVSIADYAASSNGGKEPVIAEDYEYQVLIPWGTPLDPNGPIAEYTGDPNTRPSSADQAEMIGIGHDGMWLFPMGNANDHGVLCINHEFGRNSHVLGKNAPETLEDVRLSQHAHGVSVVEIKEISGKWQPVTSNKSRRVHVNTPVAFSGPVAGSPLLDNPAGNTPQGTVNNCSNGYTPWGTYLTCEENFNGYFGATEGRESFQGTDSDGNVVGPDTRTEEQLRYGFDFDGFGYGWEKFDPRFDMSNPDYVNEQNRFGWVVEIDPMDGTQTPVKRTALGRFKHEGVAVTVGAGGRVVCYMGDDQRFDYIYKFVSAGNWRGLMRRGIHPLDRGKLYVAKFNDNGTGNWLELTIRNPALAARFSDQAEVLTYARIAADILGATPMDRPEWTTAGPDGYIYCTLTNNSQRSTDPASAVIRNGVNIALPDAANPEAPNNDGYIIRWKDSRNYTGNTFVWDLPIKAIDTRGTESVFTDPDGLWADPDGRLFIETDGGQPDSLNNQMLVADASTLEIKRLLVGVNSDEITGLTVTPDRQTLFCNTQHPGNGNPASTNFPAPTDGVTIPRDCTFVITRKGGGIVGS